MIFAHTLPTSSGPFFTLGVEHIFTGYDHLLFLLGLLLVCVRWQTLIAIITCFTVGHSLTLFLATTGIVNPPAELTEPLIALTILYVGAENLWRRGAEPGGRWALTLLFGLVHGFGFANVLRELGVGTEGHSLLVPLFSFNLGVETGQILFAGVVLPILWRARRIASFRERWVPVLSGLVAVAGLYWLLERVLLS